MNKPATFVSLTLGLILVSSNLALSQTLERFASLPADTFAPGPTSGQFITAANERVPPFEGKQPVQGISSVLRAWNGDYLVMSDNGFGAKENSPDYVLRVYRISPEFRSKLGGSGKIKVRNFITLSDPDRKVNFPIVADEELYPNSAVPVDDTLRRRRWLTGGDFDIESFREAPDGTLWFGDEFGPFLLHTDKYGRVLQAPFPLPGVKSPQNPFLEVGESPNLGRSKGFEGMAITPDGKTLYTLLEGPLSGDDPSRLIINQFDLRVRRFSTRTWSYRLESPDYAIGDLTALTRTRFLVIERDNGQGATALFKKIFVVNLEDVDAQGDVVKQEVADLMNIADPHNLGGQGAVFTFPFQTIESVIPLGPRTLGVLDDNNYPFSAGRVAGQPDPNEFIIIRLEQPLYDRPRGDHDDDHSDDEGDHDDRLNGDER